VIRTHLTVRFQVERISLGKVGFHQVKDATAQLPNSAPSGNRAMNNTRQQFPLSSLCNVPRIGQGIREGHCIAGFLDLPVPRTNNSVIELLLVWSRRRDGSSNGGEGFDGRIGNGIQDYAQRFPRQTWWNNTHAPPCFNGDL
jgi:hypothetical protein